jgi:flagellar biosynthesis/type III secretory pathway protein FliH
MSIWARVSPIAITSAAVAVSITEIGGYIAMLVREWEERFERKRAERLARQEQMKAQARQAGLEEGRQAGLEEGHEMERKVWIAWAEQQGLPIDELPPPSSRT